ncbi:hypothetical protein Pdsh_02955 [Pyrodictium delaneyi]|uniref:FUN14 family protein n=2 Tax=Pyrodictium delaneyi TaxID=1273541 RepID=A0A211YNZ5_9CREN|nr:hypothetical protein Pdsh_02955 [Pyrodictium delaneyi]
MRVRRLSRIGVSDMPANATDIGSVLGLVELIQTNPQLAVAIILQLLLGFAAGYYMAKVAKYVLALVGVFVLGSLIGVWGASGSVQDAVARLQNLAEFKDTAISIMKLFSFLMVGPTAVGFIVGIIVGLTRK